MSGSWSGPTASTATGRRSSRRSPGYHLEQAHRYLIELGLADEHAVAVGAEAVEEARVGGPDGHSSAAT